MDQLIESLSSTLGQSLPGVFGALVILFVGWIIAIGIRAILRKTLNLCKLNEKINGKSKGTGINLENGVATGGYYLVLLIALLAVFNQLGLEIASQPIEALTTQVMDFIPKIIGGGVLILVAWLCGKIIKEIITGTLAATSLDKKFKSEKNPLSQTFGEIAYWLVFLMFLPGILGVFELEGLLAPAQSMVNQITSMLPNILAATIIITVGWFVAKILGELVTNISSVAGLDMLGEKAGIKGKSKLSNIFGMIVYFFVFVPAIIAGLNALKIAAIADPATQMLTSIMTSIPNIIGAAAIILITYFVARPVCAFISSLLTSAGFDNLPAKMGLKTSSGKNKSTPSNLVGSTVFFFMILFASVEAANRLAFDQFSELVAMFIQFGGQVLLGSVIIVIGLWIANVVGAAMNAGGKTPMATLVRVVILGLVLAMGLRAMGLANDIVNMAFGLTLGAAAIAFALAFGIGGRDAAGRQMEHWFQNLRGGGKSSGKDRTEEKTYV